MSEYQYYEFLAIDRPLTKREMAALRDISSRADITPRRFTNEYHWGDFSGDPDRLMTQFFDAHVYVANWGSAVFMVRLPIEALAAAIVEAIAVAEEVLEFTSTKKYWVIGWYLREGEDYDRFGMEDGAGWMAQLAPIRDELLRGDLRSLYIGWLPTVMWDIQGDDELEPLAVSGLGNLTPAQQALAEFLEVDPDLLAGAAMGSPAALSNEVSEQEMEAWIDDLPRDDVTAILKQFLEGRGRRRNAH